MARAWTSESGASRRQSTSRRRSFRHTSAARTIRLSLALFAIADSVRIEHGATTMPSVRKVPLAGPAATLRSSWQTSASAATSAGVRPSSYSIVFSAPALITRWTSMSSGRSTSSRRTP